MSVRCVVRAAQSALVCSAVLAAQPAPSNVAPAQRGSDLSARRFSRSSGLEGATVYGIARDSTGRIWLGAEDGFYSSAGSQWRREQLPSDAKISQVRAILFDASHAMWLATRQGAFRLANGQWRWWGQAQGVPGSVVYSLTETRAIDGTPRVVLGARTGACVIVDSLCRAVTPPPTIVTAGIMARSVREEDGNEALWLASSSGGAARFKGGTWTVFGAAQGLASQTIEELATVPATSRVFAGGVSGVFELRRAADGTERFEALRNSPRAVTRVSWVPRGKSDGELWVGTVNGAVLRWRGAQWDTVLVEGERARGQVTLMTPMVHDGDTRAVYLGTRSARLTRLSFGAAIAFALPGRAGRDLVNGLVQLYDSAHLGQALIATLGAGATVVDSLGRLTQLGTPTDSLVAAGIGAYWGPLRHVPVSARGMTEDPSALILGHLGPAIARNNAWVPFANSASIRPFSLRRVSLLDGSSATVASTAQGLRFWDDTAWVPVPRAPQSIVTDVLSTVRNGQRLLLLAMEGGVATMSDEAVHFDSIAPTVPVSTQPVLLKDICEIRRPTGALLFVAGEFGTVAWRELNATGSWHALPRQFIHALNASFRVTVACDSEGGRLLLGSSDGLLVADVRDTDPTRWTVRAVLGLEDGLPSLTVTRIGVPFHDRLWVGTDFGAAIVELDRATMPPPVPLNVRVVHAPSGEVVEDGAQLPPSSDQLRVEVWLDTHRREDDSRYLIEWRQDPHWWDSAGRRDERNDTTWSELSTRYITGITPGSYRLRVRGRDFAGREAAMVERHFVILAPWWRSWYALVAYAALVFAALAIAYRWRISVLAKGTAQLVESERRLRGSERRFRALFEDALDPHLLVDGDRVIKANAKAAELFGVADGHALVGRTMDSLLPPELQADDPAHPSDRITRQGGVDVPLQVTSTLISDEQTTLQHFVLRDLTAVRQSERARERMESHLRERQRLEALGTLAGGVAHDFNNLLGVIRGNAELASASAADPNSTREHMASIVDASDRARDLVRQILTFSRNPIPRQERVDLSALLRNLQPLLRRMIPTSVQIVLTGADVPHVVDGDPAQLEQVVLNLASNAEHAMRVRGAGTLTLGLTEIAVGPDGPPPVGRVVRLTVSDTGVGMRREVRERIFEPFFTTKPVGEGSGLGMAVLHGVVVAHGGRVQLESTPDVGTTVEVLLPHSALAANASAPVVVLPTPRGTPTTQGGARIVVVDDEPAVANVMTLALERAGHAVRKFNEPALALEAIRQHPDEVDLLVTDQTMPGITGDLLAERVRAVAPHVAVLILTGFSHLLTPERARAVGAVEVLEKPVVLATLLKAVDAAVGWENRQRA